MWIRIIFNLKESPLFTLIVKMVIPVFINQFNSNAIVQGDNHIIKRRNIYRYYNTIYNAFFILLHKIPFIIIFVIITVPILIIQSCYKNIVFTNYAG